MSEVKIRWCVCIHYVGTELFVFLFGLFCVWHLARIKSKLVTFLYPKFSEILLLLIISSWSLCVYKCIILGLRLWVIMGAVLPLSFSALSEPNFHAAVSVSFSWYVMLSASLPMTVPYWWPTAVFAWKLWPMFVRHCEDVIRYLLLKGWWEHFVPQAHWC